MSFEDINEQSNDLSFVEMMEYLISKLENRYNSIINFNSQIDACASPDSFFSLRKDFKLLFNDIEEAFRQSIFAIKALTAQNKTLTDELKIKIKENKNITEELNQILSENKNLKLKTTKFKENLPKTTNNNNYKRGDNNKNKNIDIDKIDKEEKYEERNNNENEYTFNNKNKVIKEKYVEKRNYNNNYEMEQLSNVKNIMDNMKKNKMRLKMAIEQHFNNNSDK